MFVRLLQDKRIILGVSGSIAAYKAIDLASKLTQFGTIVDTILTESAQRFVKPLSFQTVTGRKASYDIWAEDEHVRHVKLGETADLFVIAPTTAQTIAKLSHGLADNLLCVTALAARCPVMIFPAMDGGMYENAATQHNLDILRKWGYIIIEPGEGRMASGLIGKGRLIEPEQIIGHIRLILGKEGSLSGRKVVVSAGPTQEPIDPVRFLSNRSSGRQGIALAQAAIDLGADVTLVPGPTTQPLPIGARIISVRTASEMCREILRESKDADILIMAAAVADFRPETQAQQKIKKTAKGLEMSIKLTSNPDILMSIKQQRQETGRPLITVGFAAETQNALEFGREKMERKGLDYIAINDVSDPGAGFSVETNRVTLLDNQGGIHKLPLQSKNVIAERIVERISSHFTSRTSDSSEQELD